MAKKIDTSKIERIRQASVEVISEHGISGSSVATIARRAQVSAGYLYRHYPSKVELVNDLLNDALQGITDRINTLIARDEPIANISKGIIRYILENAVQNPHRIKFIIMLLNDFSTRIDDLFHRQVEQIGQTLILKGLRHHSIRTDLTIADFYLALVGIPLQYLATRYRFDANEVADLSQEEICNRETEKLQRLSLRAIQ